MLEPPTEIEWSRKALERLQEIRDFVALDKPDAAERLAIRIITVVQALRTQPRLGRPSAQAGVRELIIGGTPYIVMYRATRKSIRILNIWHGAQKRRH